MSSSDELKTVIIADDLDANIDLLHDNEYTTPGHVIGKYTNASYHILRAYVEDTFLSS